VSETFHVVHQMSFDFINFVFVKIHERLSRHSHGFGNVFISAGRLLDYRRPPVQIN
jgi:hypothetical protein